MSFPKTKFKRPIIRSTRQQESSSSDDDDERESSVVINLNHKKRKNNPMIQSTSSFPKSSKKSKRISHDDDDDDDESDEYESIKQNSINVHYESTKSTTREGPADMGATSTLEIDTEKDQSTSKINKNNDDTPDNVYKGVKNYAQYTQKREDAPKGFIPKGPVRAPENIRSTVRWDYQPDICKDYKETGFCGFGDSCKFLHDRSDYKAGWQIDLEVDNSNKRHGHGQDDDDTDYRIQDDDDDLPFACFICRESFTNPVVTKCKHYFCQTCALDHFKKTTRCFVCNAQTNGVFNVAKEIVKRLEIKNAKIKQSKNETQYDDDDDEEEDDDDN